VEAGKQLVQSEHIRSWYQCLVQLLAFGVVHELRVDAVGYLHTLFCIGSCGHCLLSEIVHPAVPLCSNGGVSGNWCVCSNSSSSMGVRHGCCLVMDSWVVLVWLTSSVSIVSIAGWLLRVLSALTAPCFLVCWLSSTGAKGPCPGKSSCKICVQDV
jgi:hypothetical protein